MSFNSNEGASSSSPSSSSWWKYDVFVSFRGEDTQKKFTDHLCKALNQKGVIIFKDDQKLERGKPIKPELLQAIEESRFSIVVFSRNYATSSWCLDELVKIVECMKEIGQAVLPVFYDVNPTEVRNQTGSFGKAFHEHEKAIGAEKMEKWRRALIEVANLSGWDLQDRHEATFIQNIVKEIWTKLSNLFSSVSKGLVGIDSVLEEMNSYLEICSNDVRMIGICGMGGIGKTTIAKVIYDKFSHQFEGSSFVSNVRQVSKIHGLVALREQLLSETLIEEDINLLDANMGMFRWLRNKKVFIVLDDVDNLHQLETLAGDPKWFGPGSRIVITTRDEHLLKAHDVDIRIYKTKCLNTNDALQLFSFKALKKNHLAEDYVALFKDIVSYTNGLPLALVVLGSYLCGRSVNEWRSALQLIETPKMEIFDVLKISYDSLEEIEKKIFLDISCLLNLRKVNRVIEILDACNFYPEIGLRVLIDKSLVLIDNITNQLDVHSLLQEMAQAIVYQESPKEPGRRSRLWLYDDINQVLRKKTGTEAVEVIYMSSSQSKDIFVDADAFVGMNNLRLLKIHDVQLPNGLGFLPNELRILKWHGYPLKSFPSTLIPKKLVELDMSHGGILLLWKESVHLDRLKIIKLSHSKKLTRILDFRGFPNLERLILEGCTRLYEFHPSIGDLQRLVLLNLKGCENLQSLPKIVSGWKCLKFLLLLGCSKIEKLPENLGDCEDLEELDAGKTVITEAPSSIATFKKLKKLSFHGCKGQTLKHWNWLHSLLVGGGPISLSFSLPSQMAGLLSLTHLDLSYCNLSAIPRDIGKLSALSNLDLKGNEIVSLPASFNQLSKLVSLNLADCKKLQTLSELPSSIKILNASNCSSLKTLIGTPGLSGGFFFENCFRLLENRRDEDVALSLLKQHLLFLTKIRIREIFSHFLYCSEKQESNDPHIARLAKFIRSWMSYLPQESAASLPDLSQLRIVLPGSSILDWFTFQTMNDRITTELPPSLCCDGRFLGLAVCASFGVKEHERWGQKEMPAIFVRYSDVNMCQGSFGVVWNSHIEELPVSDFLFLGFLPSRVKHPSEMDSHTVKGTITIRASSYFEFKKWGIRTVYLKDTELIQTMFHGPNVPQLEDIIQLSRPKAGGRSIFEQSCEAHFYSDGAGPSGTGTNVHDSTVAGASGFFYKDGDEGYYRIICSHD